MPREYLIFKTPHCYVAYIIGEIHIVATGETAEACIQLLHENMHIWDEMLHEERVEKILKQNNINGAHKSNQQDIN